MATFLLTTPSISQHDAVSNDVFAQAELLRSNGHGAYIYAEHAPAELRPLLVKDDEFGSLARSPSVIWMYHHSVLWDKGEHLLRTSRARKIMRYHNITPTHFFESVEDHGAVHATRYGIEQTKRFMKEGFFDLCINASRFNSEDLVSLGGNEDDMVEVGPFHKIDDFGRATLDTKLADKVNVETRVNVLFVGRFAPNKGHIHMFRALERYASLFGENIQLHIAGNIHIASPKYREQLQEEVATLEIGDMLTIWNNVSHNQLHTLYSVCDAFLLMSEHEGFCVPIIEAQHHKLPIVAYGSTAIPETLGENQIYHAELDYDLFAASLNVVATDGEVAGSLASAGQENATKYALSNLQQRLIKALHRVL